jgi:hypothetical protein
MGRENPSWGEERIANELLLKLGIQVSPRTVRKYLPPRPPGRPRGDMRWSTFLRLRAQGIIACDFLVVVTATLRLFYVFVVIEPRSRRLIRCNVTAHPTSAWTLQQLREAARSHRANSILGGLHHEYSLAPACAWLIFCGPQAVRLRSDRLPRLTDNYAMSSAGSPISAGPVRALAVFIMVDWAISRATVPQAVTPRRFRTAGRRRPISAFTARLFWPPDAVAGFYTNLTGGPTRIRKRMLASRSLSFVQAP